MSLLKQSHLRDARAKEQLTELETVLRHIREGILDTGFSEDEPSPDQIKRALDKFLRDVWTESPRWLLLVSEVVFHLRASLDYIIFVCARVDSGREQDGTQFPINTKPQYFARNRTGCLKHLTEEHIALVERFQPYRGSNLQLLNRLSNVDKHRHFIHWSASSAFSTTRMNLGLHLSQTQADPILAAIDKGMRKMGMYMYHGPEVLIDDGTPVCEALQILHSEVCNIVNKFNAVLK